jgi:glycosyltransferase involved in cell wall biosynthesis
MTTVLMVGKGAPDRGGIPTFLETLLGSKLAQEHDLRFLNVAHAGTPEGGRASLGNLWRTVQDAAAVWRRAADCDIVHIHSALAPTVTVLRAALLALAGRARGCAVVVHAHGGNIQSWLTTPLRRSLLRLAMLPAHRVVACWTAGEEALRRVLPASRVMLIDNGVPVDGYPDRVAEHDPPRILYVGLLTPRKGVLDRLAASRVLQERGVRHETWLLGGTPDEGPAAEAEVRAGLDGSAKLLGTRAPEQMPAEFAAADVFCLPSWWEAMPLSVLEAMAAGLPVVATDVGDVRRSVVDGVTGHVVPVRSPEKLADALEHVLVDPERRRAMGAAGRARVVEMFSADVTAARVSELYDELAATAVGRRPAGGTR